MVQLVGYYEVSVLHNRRYGAGIAGKPRLEYYDRFLPFELGQYRLHLVMYVHGAYYGPYRAGPGAVFFHRFNGGFLKPRVVGKTQVVVGRKVYYLLPVYNRQGSRRPLEFRKFPVHPLLFEFINLLLQEMHFVYARHFYFSPSNTERSVRLLILHFLLYYSLTHFPP